MADKVFRVKVCDIPDCPTPQDDVRVCTLGINSGAPRKPDLCVGHRVPLQELIDKLPRKQQRGRTKGITDKVVRPEDIPRLTAPAKKAPARRTPSGRSPRADGTTKKTPGR